MELFTSDSGVVVCREGFPLSAMLTLVVLVGVVLGIAVPAMAEGPCPDCSPYGYVACGTCRVVQCYASDQYCPSTPHFRGNEWCNTPTYPGCFDNGWSCYYSCP